MNLMTVMKMKREPCLSRPLKEDVASAESLDTRQWIVDPAVDSRTTTTTTTTITSITTTTAIRVGQTTLMGGSKESVIIVENMDTGRRTAERSMEDLAATKTRTTKQLKK